MRARMYSLAIAVGCFVLVTPPALRAQLNRGSIEGIVTDPQGAAIPNVAVTVTSVATNVPSKTTTNRSGSYLVESLVPGEYAARFEAKGFEPLQLVHIQVTAGLTSRQDAQLHLGATVQTMEVSAAASQVQTEATNYSSNVASRQVSELPLAGRDLQQLVNLIPGVNNESGPPGSNFGFNSQFGSFPDPTHAQGSDVTVNGGQGSANAWYLDGNLNLSAFNENVAVNPSPDAVDEFQGITNSLAAEYGRTGGGVFNVTLKSGGNDLHGDVYEYVRNSATNARNPFTSIDATGHIIPQDQLRYNNFGGTLGGPVYLPHLYNGKNRTFFFFSYDVAILHLSGNNVYTVPTALMRTGDFSEDPSVVSNGLWDPYSTNGPDPVTGLFQRTAFGTPAPGNPFGASGCLNSSVEAGATAPVPYATCNFATAIPQARLDPTAMFFVNSFPLPNYNDPLSACPQASSGNYKICQNYLGSVGSSLDTDNVSIKIDHQWSDKSKYFGEWLFNPSTYNNYRVPWTGPTFPWSSVGFGGQYPIDVTSQIIALGNTYTLSPTLINEFRASFSRQFITTHPSHPYPDSITDQSQVQSTLAPLKIPVSPFFPIPTWNMNSPGGGSITFGPLGWVNMTTAAEAYTILDNVTKVLGRHTFKTGFVYRLEHTAYTSGFPTGLNFYGEQVEDPTTGVGGSGLAQFMLGAVSSQGRNSSTGLMWTPYESFHYTGLYLQDDFRLTPSFTVNVGLRWDVFGRYATRNRPNSNFCLGCPNSVTGIPGKVIYSGDPDWPGNGTSIGPPNYNDFAPRVNFSWAPKGNQKTVIRGGYDIFYSNALASLNSPGQAAANAPGWNQEYDWQGSFYPNQCTPLSGECVAFPLSDMSTNKADLTTPPIPSQFPAQQKAPLIGIGLMQFFTPPSHDPIVQEWNLQVQRQLPGNLMVTVGYVGTHGTHLMGEPFRQFNYLHYSDLVQYKTSINSDVPITDYYSGQTANELAAVYGSSTLPRTILLKQNPFYGALSSLQNNTAFDGASIYHALNVTVQKRYSNGLNFLLAYTWDKEIDNAAVGQPAILLVNPVSFARSNGVGGRAGALGIGYSTFQNPDNRKEDRTLASNDIPQIFNVALSYDLPFGKGRRFRNQKGLVNDVIGGWKIVTNFNAQTGAPLGITCPSDQVTSRCDLVGNPQFSGGRSRAAQEAQWLNPAAFQPSFGSDTTFWANYDPNDPRAYQYGTMAPRVNNIRAPGFWGDDATLMKEFHLTENRYFQFRWELFNAFNHQALGLPNNNWCLPPNPDGSTDKVHQAGCAFGLITNVQIDPRNMEFALKFYF